MKKTGKIGIETTVGIFLFGTSVSPGVDITLGLAHAYKGDRVGTPGYHDILIPHESMGKPHTIHTPFTYNLHPFVRALNNNKVFWRAAPARPFDANKHLCRHWFSAYLYVVSPRNNDAV